MIKNPSTPPPIVREALATVNARQAVKTAGERLEAIETWARRTFYAAIVGAACLAPVAICATFAIYQYIRVSIAISHLSDAPAMPDGRSGR